MRVGALELGCDALDQRALPRVLRILDDTHRFRTLAMARGRSERRKLKTPAETAALRGRR